jgi:hypothetical protein
VEPEQVVLGQSESADRRLRVYPTVRPMPVVLMRPSRKFLRTVVRRGVGLSIGPFPEGGLDETLGFAIGFGCVGLGADVLDAELAAGVAEGEGFVTTTVVGHDAGDGNAQAGVVGHSRLEERKRAIRLLVGLDLGEGDALRHFGQ